MRVRALIRYNDDEGTIAKGAIVEMAKAKAEPLIAAGKFREVETKATAAKPKRAKAPTVRKPVAPVTPAPSATAPVSDPSNP